PRRRRPHPALTRAVGALAADRLRRALPRPPHPRVALGLPRPLRRDVPRDDGVHRPRPAQVVPRPLAARVGAAVVEVSWEERERTELRPSPRGRVVGAAVSVAVVVLAVAGLARGFGWPAWGEDEALPKLLPVHEPRTIHVAVDGDDDDEGAPDEPLRTIGSAVRASGAADTIVVHGGTYHEELKIEHRPGLHLVAAPGAEVWLDGSVAVEHWVPDGDVWVAPGWGTRLDASPTYSWGAEDHDQPGWSFIDPEYPMAAHPDQVWVEDRKSTRLN